MRPPLSSRASRQGASAPPPVPPLICGVGRACARADSRPHALHVDSRERSPPSPSSPRRRCRARGRRSTRSPSRRRWSSGGLRRARVAPVRCRRGCRPLRPRRRRPRQRADLPAHAAAPARARDDRRRRHAAADRLLDRPRHPAHPAATAAPARSPTRGPAPGMRPTPITSRRRAAAACTGSKTDLALGWSGRGAISPVVSIGDLADCPTGLAERLRPRRRPALTEVPARLSERKPGRVKQFRIAGTKSWRDGRAGQPHRPGRHLPAHRRERDPLVVGGDLPQGHETGGTSSSEHGLSWVRRWPTPRERWTRRRGRARADRRRRRRRPARRRDRRDGPRRRRHPGARVPARRGSSAASGSPSSTVTAVSLASSAVAKRAAAASAASASGPSTTPPTTIDLIANGRSWRPRAARAAEQGASLITMWASRPARAWPAGAAAAEPIADRAGVLGGGDAARRSSARGC